MSLRPTRTSQPTVFPWARRHRLGGEAGIDEPQTGARRRSPPRGRPPRTAPRADGMATADALTAGEGGHAHPQGRDGVSYMIPSWPRAVC
ncbi:hypothetical protein QJS66_09240 [Kocuria rhizophila]|nr:hypothetical protein QJS66_09240 [Kocuria rhizophila]